MKCLDETFSFDIISFFANSEPKRFSCNNVWGNIDFQELSGSESEHMILQDLVLMELLAVNNFIGKSPTQIFERLLNTPLKILKTFQFLLIVISNSQHWTCLSHKKKFIIVVFTVIAIS